MRTSIKPQAITTGEPAGIGPEVSVKAAWKSPSPVILVGDRDMLLAEARRLGLPEPPAQVSFHHVPLAETPVPGKLSLKNAAYVIETLAAAHRLCADGTAGASSRLRFKRASSLKRAFASRATRNSSLKPQASRASS